MSLEKMDTAGFVFTVVTLVLGLGFVWLLIARRLPPRQVEEIDSALADTVKYLDQLNNSGRTVKNDALHNGCSFKERCDGLSADVTREWTELGWKRFLHPRPKALIGPCNILFNEVAKMRKELIAESPFKLGEVPPVSNAGPITSSDNHKLVSPSTSQLSINSSSPLVSNAQQLSVSQPEASPPMPADPGSAPSPSGSLLYPKTTASTSHSDARAVSVPRIIESKQEAVHPERRDPNTYGRHRT